MRVSILAGVRCVSRRRGRLHDDRTHRGSAARAGPSQRSAARRAPRRRPPLLLPRPRPGRRPRPSVAPAGPAPGLAYAGLGVRIVALIIDYILLLIVFWFVSIALGAIFLGTLISGGTAGVADRGVLLAIANLAISAVYFIWTLDESGHAGVARPACPRARTP